MKTLSFVFILFLLFSTNCTRNENMQKIEANEIKQDYLANYYWLEGWLTFCSMMGDISDTNNLYYKGYYRYFTKTIPNFTKQSESNILKEIIKFSKEYPLKRLYYGHLIKENQREIRGVIAIYKYDPTVELRYVFCLEPDDYFRIANDGITREDEVDIEYSTKKHLERELDKQRKYTIYKYMMKIKGEFIPFEGSTNKEKSKAEY